MGTFSSFRKAFDALKDSTKVGLAKVNSEFKELDIAIVKATNHVESPPKERYVRRILYATSVIRPRADVAYCIHALAKRLAKTRSWIVAVKALIVIHRTMREGDPSFREELTNYSHRGNILQISNFKDDSSPMAWDCSAWVRAYALFLEERLECYRSLRYDIEAERMTRASSASYKGHIRTRVLGRGELLDQLPALQKLLYRLIDCQPEGAAYCNYLIQYGLALVLKESFKLYCSINDGIINLVDMFFDMSRHDAVKALNIYKRAGQQAENLAEFYEYCKSLDLARSFHFPILRQPPASFLATMEEYIKEAARAGSNHRRLENEGTPARPNKPEESQVPVEEEAEKVEENEQEKVKEEAPPKDEIVEPPPWISTDDIDLLGLNEINPKAAELEQHNALALAIIPPGSENASSSLALTELGKPNATGWELALVTTPSNNTSKPAETKLGGGFDRLLLDSLYEDEGARRQLQFQNAGYGYGGMVAQNPFEQQQDLLMMSYGVAPPTNVQMAMMAQQQQQFQRQQMMQQQQAMMMVPYQYQPQYPQQMQPMMSSSNPFVDPFFSPPQSSMSQQGNRMLR
ncbi:hypothetical protein K2173_017490 [Erythroxylum novogranatense]|uniref:ENTH domain-containing protein n=1 Tax=Erythroxylum novogranatense TaxID=1862640 RepID=A0AAV8TM17_9ROSI|nr:hypothetical protein K2173_017490 [Erythroxylum novogranatense]